MCIALEIFLVYTDSPLEPLECFVTSISQALGELQTGKAKGTEYSAHKYILLNYLHHLSESGVISEESALPLS